MFIRCSNLITRNPAALHGGVSVADLDGDGQDEIVVAGFAGPNRVLKWDGQALVDAADPALADERGKALAVLCADLDGDGREEAYVLNGGARRQPDRLFAGFGKRWVDLLSLPDSDLAPAAGPGRCAGVLDRSGTGRYGFLVAAEGEPLRLLELGRDGKLADVAEEAGLDAEGAVGCLLAAPLLGEQPDIFVGMEGGPNLLYRNLGDGTFEEVGEDWDLADPRQDSLAAARLDGDGLADLAVGNADGPLRLWQQRAGGSFAEVAPADVSLPAAVRTVIVADFDNDGFEEIFLHCHGEENRLFAWREDRWQEIDIGDAALPDGAATGAAVMDLDGDGQLELLLAHGDTEAQPLALFLAEPRGHHWLRVRPLTRAGAPARGAEVRLWAGGRVQGRAICGGSGHLCQMEPVAHFGLGHERKVEKVEVRWPDGTVAVVEGPKPCQTLVVRQPG